MRVSMAIVIGVAATSCVRTPIVDEAASAGEAETADEPAGDETTGSTVAETTEATETTGVEEPPVDEEPIGHSPSGGNALALWNDDELELVFSNVTTNTCDEPGKLPECGPPDSEVWVVRVRVPREVPIPGHWTPGELHQTTSTRGPVRPEGDCYGGFGSTESEMDLTLDGIDDLHVYGSFDGLQSHAGPFVAVICP
jgi:hypothetical protein